MLSLERTQSTDTHSNLVLQVIAHGMLNANLNLVEHPEYVRSLLSLLISLALTVCCLLPLCASCSHGMALTLAWR